MIVTVGSPFCKYTVNTCIWIDILTTYNSPFFPTGRLVVEMCLLPSTKCCQTVVPLEVEFESIEIPRHSSSKCMHGNVGHFSIR